MLAQSESLKPTSDTTRAFKAMFSASRALGGITWKITRQRCVALALSFPGLQEIEQCGGHLFGLLFVWQMARERDGGNLKL